MIYFHAFVGAGLLATGAATHNIDRLCFGAYVLAGVLKEMLARAERPKQ